MPFLPGNVMPEVEHHLNLKRGEFYAAYAEELFPFLGKIKFENIGTQTSNKSSTLMVTHLCLSITRNECIVQYVDLRRDGWLITLKASSFCVQSWWHLCSLLIYSSRIKKSFNWKHSLTSPALRLHIIHCFGDSG